MGSKGPAADSAGPFAGLLLGGDDGSALVLAFLLGPDLDPTLALAAILAGAGILCARAGCFAFALVDARALDPFGRVLALLLRGGVRLPTMGRQASGLAFTFALKRKRENPLAPSLRAGRAVGFTPWMG